MPTPLPTTPWDLTLDTPVSDYARWESTDAAERADFRNHYVRVVTDLGGDLDSIDEHAMAIQLQYTCSLAQYLAWPDGYEEDSLIAAIASTYPAMAIEMRGPGGPHPTRDAVRAQLAALTLHELPIAEFAPGFRRLVTAHPAAGAAALRHATAAQLRQLVPDDLLPVLRSGYAPAREVAFTTLAALAGPGTPDTAACAAAGEARPTASRHIPSRSGPR